ncbi:MAG: carboxymuconolactone decarboxylase family protein [Prolixibacteraceae bacterium]|nr:carboxymuconolactone decarboxylase family protein [Prolixibacteraceae bacterium]
MQHKFGKKIFSARIFFNDTGYLISHIPDIRNAMRDKNIGKPFIEKIMTITSAVNGCKYCKWIHAKQALKLGISEEEVKNLLNLQFHINASSYEMPALLYAQHYAETNRKPDHLMNEKLIQNYGDKTALHIITLIRIVYYGNLSGNTWDAFISRFKGKPAENSNIIFEFFFCLITIWIMVPAIILQKNN